ncbi:hypothetical protein [uncultured Paraglaciecola sp.]|uniref:hypothetical protein n=1 Tax=uncultured Paraglaciecola sp. TaxID=1765024 RepID=UPI002618DA52|nr:hypothetical protein [uncultured Paraglaciecola sp.]
MGKKEEGNGGAGPGGSGFIENEEHEIPSEVMALLEDVGISPDSQGQYSTPENVLQAIMFTKENIIAPIQQSHAEMCHREKLVEDGVIEGDEPCSCYVCHTVLMSQVLESFMACVGNQAYQEIIRRAVEVASHDGVKH